MSLKPIKFLLILLAMFCAGQSFGQVERDVVYLEDGAEYHGQVVSISPEKVLIRIGENIISLDAKDVRSIGKETKVLAVEQKPARNSVRKEPKPLDRKVLVEARGGLALINPIGLEATVGILHRLGDRSAFGLSTGFMLSNRSIVSGFLEYRRYFSKPSLSRFFLGLRPGIAVGTGNPGVFNSEFEELSSTPLKFLGAQAGWQLDSGYGIAISMNFGMNFIWYSETYRYWWSSAEVTAQYYLFKPQASLSLIF